eukprot:PhM_4_TR15970/c0_g1_i1/m.98039/K01669/phrB; deoxyribodipyrimidine photo-lyase
MSRRVSLFIFRRDLRLSDNIGLLHALKTTTSESVVMPCFIFDPRSLSPSNEFRCDNAIRFMVESLVDLEAQLKKAHKAKLYCFYGDAEDVLEKLFSNKNNSLAFDAVHVNRDYTPFSERRDNALATICKAHQVAFHSHDDLTLQPIDKTLKADGTPYVVFTPFYRRASAMTVPQPIEMPPNCNFFTTPLRDAPAEVPCTLPTTLLKGNLHSAQEYCSSGGTSAALAILGDIATFKTYETTRDCPSADKSTTGLSAHLKFGTVSPRMAFHTIKKVLGKAAEPLLRQLYWRDFYLQIAWYYPHVFGHAFRTQYDDIPWSNDTILFQHWV